MVSVPNSLSNNAVNFQKAKSAPIAIAKNISPKPVQVNKKTVPESTMRAMLKDAQAEWVDPAEIVQWLLDKWYDIEQPKTGMQKFAQWIKNVAWGGVWWLPALWPTIVWWILKWIWNIPVAPWMDLPKTPMQQSLIGAWETLQQRWEQVRWMVERWIWANPEATGTQIWRMWVPIAASIIWWWALGLTKAGAWAFNTVKTGLATRSIPTVLKGIAWSSAVWWAWQWIYDIASEGKTTPESIAIGWAIWWGIASLPVVWKVAKEYIWKPVVWQLKNLSNKLYTSWLINPKKLEYVSNALRETGDQVDNVVEWMYSKWIRWWKNKIVNSLDDSARQTRAKVVDSVTNFTGKAKDDSIRNSILEMIDAVGTPSSKTKQAELLDLQNLLAKHDDIWLDWIEVQKTKEKMDELFDIYTVAWDVKAWQKKSDLWLLRQEVRKLIEDRGLQDGVDIRMLNRDTAVARKLSEGINYKDKSDYVRELLSPFASPAVWWGIWFTQWDTMEQRIKNAVVWAIVGRTLWSTALKTNAWFYTRKVADFFSKLPAKDKVILSNLTTKLDDIKANSYDNPNNSSVSIASKSMLDTVADSIPDAKWVVSKIDNFIDDTVKVPTKLKKLVAEKKTPLKQASDSVKKMELSELWWVKTVKPNNQLKFNQWDSYEPVRLVVNDKDAMVARYWALRNKDMQALGGKTPLTEWEKLEMKRILKDLWVDDKTATARHQFLKDEAKKVRSSSKQVLHEIKDNFWNN